MITQVPPWQALFIKDGKRTLVVADIHLGFEYALAEMKVSIPSQTPKLRDRLIKLIKKTKPDRLVLLGDVKHSVPEISLTEWEDIPLFFEALQKVVDDIEIIPGNHDANLRGLIPRDVKILSPKGIVVGHKEKIALLHGHAWPHAKLLETEYMVIAHTHPVIHFVDPMGFRIIRQVWLRSKIKGEALARSFLSYHGIKSEDPRRTLKENFDVEVRDLELIVMPSFNDILSGVPANTEKPQKLLGPILRSNAVNIDEAEVLLLDGISLGRVKELRKLS